MSEIDVSHAFPEINTQQRSPGLFRINGFGVGLYGRRDTDPQTGLYVKTQCVSALFVPLFALRSYVVSAAPGGGWYVLGRVPVSGLAKLLNLLVLVAAISVVAGIGLAAYSAMPGPKADRQLAKAHELRDSGDSAGAVRGYTELARGDSDHVREADAALVAVVEQAVRDGELQQAEQTLRVAMPYLKYRAFSDPPLDPVALTIARAGEDTDAEPRELIALLDAAESLVDETEREGWFNARLDALEQLVADDPGDIDAVTELALVYEARNELGRVRELLGPVRDRLGTGEGARALGQALAEAGDADGAFQLLEPYVAAQLEALHQAEQELDRLYEQVSDRAFRGLENGDAPESWYRQYDRSSPEDQDAMVRTYIDNKLDNDAGYNTAIEEYLEMTSVVPAALDLGIARLDRARAMDDPDAQRAELEAAEQTFLSIQGAAGDSVSYQLYLGQVYYWLGKPGEGSALFDQLLVDHADNTDLLMEIARTLREVGEVEQTRAIYTQAYENETDPVYKYYIARALSAIADDADEQIYWLERSNPDEPETQASLAHAKALRAIDEGDDGTAMPLLDQAIRLYTAMPESSSSLNNGALVWNTRYQQTGSLDDLAQAVNLMGRAVDLEPGNSVLLGNALDMMFTLAYERALGDRLDLRALDVGGSTSLFGYLYRDAQGRRAFHEQLTADPIYARAKAMTQRVVLLAPKNAGSYFTLAAIHGHARDAAAVRRLIEQARTAEPDIAASRALFDLALLEDNDDVNRVLWAENRAYLETLLGDESLSPVTRAVAHAMLADVMLSQHDLGVAVDLDRAVALCEQADALAPSTNVDTMLRYALIVRARKALATDHAVLDSIDSRLDKAHNLIERFILALEADDALRAAAAAHPDVQRAAQLTLDDRDRFSDTGSTLDWAFIRQVAPDQAGPLAQAVRDDPLGQATRDLYHLLSPYYAQSVWAKTRSLEIAGDSEAARQALQDYADLGYPMP